MKKIFSQLFTVEGEADLGLIKIFPFIPLAFVLYAMYYDITFVKYKPDALWYFAKTFFIIFPFFCVYTKLIPKKYRTVALGLNWILYCTYNVYFISLSYYVAFIQVIVAFSVMVIYTRLQYIFFSAVCLLASIFAITHAQHEMFYVAPGMSAKEEILINSICFQGLCYLIYYFVTLPRIMLSESDKKFADYGKTSSFIMHEMAKPLQRMNQNPENFKEELARLNEVYSIANSIRSTENQKINIEKIEIENLIEDIIKKYSSFIAAYKIEISVIANSHDISSDRKLLEFAIDNFIRNAIEANVEFQGKRFIKISVTANTIVIKNPFYDSSFTKANLFKPMSSTKKGHMGVGLYISKMIADNLSHHLHVDVSKELFEVKISI